MFTIPSQYDFTDIHTCISSGRSQDLQRLRPLRKRRLTGARAASAGLWHASVSATTLSLASLMRHEDRFGNHPRAGMQWRNSARLDAEKRAATSAMPTPSSVGSNLPRHDGFAESEGSPTKSAGRGLRGLPAITTLPSRAKMSVYPRSRLLSRRALQMFFYLFPVVFWTSILVRSTE